MPATTVAPSEAVVALRRQTATEPEESLVPATPPLPWDRSELARQVCDHFGRPLADRPFLHWSMNNGTYLKRNIPYFRVRVETLIGTGSIKKKLTDEQVGAIDTQLASYNTTIVQIEEQYWPLLDKNWHLAVERGDYIVREEVGGYEGAMQLLAKFGKENVDWLMAGSALQSGRSAMVFLHRESAPEVLKMHDEIMRVQAAGLTLAADLAAQY